VARSKKNQDAIQTISDAINAPAGEFIADIAEKLDISIGELRERLASKLDNDDPLDWDVVTPENFAHVDAIARDLEAERSTRKLEPQTEPPQLPEASEQFLEPPLLEEKPEPKPKRQRRSSALTQKKEGEIKQQRTSSKQTRSGVREAQILSSANTGAKHGAESGTAYLAGYVANRDNVIGTGLTTLIAEDLQEISQGSDFSPEEVLVKLGIPTSSETQQRLMEKISPALGKAQEAVQQVTATAWGNGIHLDAELTALENLMNCDE
jgi:hypothetical protein